MPPAASHPHRGDGPEEVRLRLMTEVTHRICHQEPRCSAGTPAQPFHPARQARPWQGWTLALLCAAVSAGLATPTAARSQPWPFEGSWDCERRQFHFSAALYDPGEQPMPILDIAAEGDTFILTFAQDYQLSLAMNPDGSMTWYSPVSGDSFLCRKAR